MSAACTAAAKRMGAVAGVGCSSSSSSVVATACSKPPTSEHTCRKLASAPSCPAQQPPCFIRRARTQSMSSRHDLLSSGTTAPPCRQRCCSLLAQGDKECAPCCHRRETAHWSAASPVVEAPVACACQRVTAVRSAARPGACAASAATSRLAMKALPPRRPRPASKMATTLPACTEALENET